MKNICVAIGSRANYSSAKPIMRAIQEHPNLYLTAVCYATSILDRFGSLDNVIENDGFTINERIFSHVEGESPVSMVKSTGLALIEIGNSLFRLKPDCVVVVGDRYEVMAPAVAASYLNIPLVHTMGGEVTGTIDESIRHAISKLAHIHFAANQDAVNRLIAMGEDPEFVFNSGCPRIDEVAHILTLPFNDYSFIEKEGVGSNINIDNDFLLFSFHPVTTEIEALREQTNILLDAIEKINLPTIGLWPNSDAGADIISRRIRSWRENGKLRNVRFCKNFPLDIYIHLMDKTKCLLGNSSSGIREGAYIGTPVVNVGTRQNKRLRGKNVIDIEYDLDLITTAIKKQIDKKKYPKDTLYGNGNASQAIVETLANMKISPQKQIKI
jgi:UDP-hydrolysing UDP-N-acetyl-D-glucosamine 2-epimerase